MIYIVIGQSAAGKTTFVKEKFMSEGNIIQREGLVPYVECGKTCIIGKYGTGVREEGTDAISYNAIKKIFKQVSILSRGGWDVVVEGYRIYNRNFFTAILMENTSVKLFMFTCSIATSMNRLSAAGSTIPKSFVKCTRTKGVKFFIEFGPQMDGEIIDTERHAA